MNAVLDVLKLRRIKFDYISPAVCPGCPVASSSGSGVFVEANDGPTKPVIRFDGQCASFLLWNTILDLVCITVLKSQNPTDPESPYVSLVECLPAYTVRTCSPGWWSITTIDNKGVESAPGTPVKNDGTGTVDIGIPRNAGDKAFRLYKNPDSANVSSPYSRVLESTTFGALELCEKEGCYRAQAITDDGISDLTDPICRTEATGCCGEPQPCPPGFIWDDQLCSCVTCHFDEIRALFPAVCVGAPFSATFEAHDAVGPVFWEHIDGVLPTGLLFGAGEVAGVYTTLSGTPQEAGLFVFTVRATDAGGCVREKQFQFSTLQVSPVPLPDGETDTAYSQQINETGGISPFFYSVTSGQIPSGMALSDSGLVSGTPTFTGFAEITVTDQAGAQCKTSVAVNGCPTVSLYDSIPPWDNVGNQTMTFDQDRRLLWLPESPNANPPYARIALVDTASRTFIGYMSDPSGFVSTALRGNYGNFNRGLIDTKYNQFVLSAHTYSPGFWTFADRDSHEVLACASFAGLFVDMAANLATYDSARGYIYNATSALGNPQTIVAVDCNPNNRSVLFSSAATAGIFGGSIAYCPDNDLVYVGNGGGGSRNFYLWDPNTRAYDYTPPGSTASGGSHNASVFYLPFLHLVAVWVGGAIRFLDPNNGNALVGSATFSGIDAGIFQMVDSPCSGLIYFDQYGMVGCSTIDPNNGFAVGSVPGLPHQDGDIAFDFMSNRLFVYDNATKGIMTSA
jgi:hypothetical protein